MPLLGRRGRKRRRRTAVVVVAVIAAAEVGAQLLAPVLEPVPIDWPNATTELKQGQLELLEGSAADGTDIPVSFVGDTAAQQAFLPSTFAAIDIQNRLSYNAAIPGGVPGVVRPWLLDEVIPSLESELVVWGIAMSDIAEGYGDAEIDAYQSSLGAKDSILAGLERSLAEASALVRLRPALRDPSLLAGERRDEVVQDADEADALLGPGGQRLGYQPGPSDVDAADAQLLLGDFMIDESDVADIGDTIARLQRRGKNVVLVELPTSPQVLDLLPNGPDDLSAFRTTLAEIATAADTPLFRAIGPFSEEDFVDHVHVTKEAAETITGQVAAALPTFEFVDDDVLFGPGIDFDRVIAQVDDEGIRNRLVLLSAALDAMDVSCNAPTRWRERSADVRAVIDQLTETVTEDQSEEIQRFRSGVLARRIADAVGARALLQSGCESGPIVGPIPSRREYVTRTAQLVAAYERLDAALRPPEQSSPSRFWAHPDQVFHVEGLRDDVAAGSALDVAFFGSSETRSGIDPTLFAELTGQRAANLSITRATPEVTAPWIRDAGTIVLPDLIVWGVAPTDLTRICDLDARRASYTEPAAARDQIFETLQWAPPGSDFDRILGPADESIYSDTRTSEVAFAPFEPGSRGTTIAETGTDEATIETETRFYLQRVSGGNDCVERLSRMADDVRALVNDGRRVVVVGLPSFPDLLAAHPSGPDGLLGLFGSSMEELVAVGAEYVDLTDTLTREDFHTTTNYNDQGRQALTERLADVLG